MISFLYLFAALDPNAALSVLENETAADGPGIAAVVIGDDEVVLAAARGLADIESGEPLTVDTPMYAGSISKVFTAMIVLKLVDDGRLTLDEQPDFGQSIDRRVPFDVKLLLSHASGLPREGDFGYWFSARFPDETALREYVTQQAPQVRPGGKARYSNVGYAVLGLTAEQSTGRPFSALLTDLVVGPLGLETTGGPGPVAGIAR
ncbi:MAG: serine hydrolase domain-containing protein, partial [Pseudomonadota bacterium]